MTINDMFSLSQKNDLTWGLEEYEIPVQYFDHQKQIAEKNNMAIVTGEKKPAKSEVNKNAKRPDLTDEIEKKHKDLPEPWRYDVSLKWMKGSKDDCLSQFISKSQQMSKFKWTNVPKEKQIFQEKQKQTRGKPDMNAKKNTFIDEIVHKNSKKNYPMPGSTDYHLDDIVIKKFFAEKSDLLLRKVDNTKSVKCTLPLINKEREESLYIDTGKISKEYASSRLLSERRELKSRQSHKHQQRDF